MCQSSPWCFQDRGRFWKGTSLLSIREPWTSPTSHWELVSVHQVNLLISIFRMYTFCDQDIFYSDISTRKPKSPVDVSSITTPWGPILCIKYLANNNYKKIDRTVASCCAECRKLNRDSIKPVDTVWHLYISGFWVLLEGKI